MRAVEWHCQLNLMLIKNGTFIRPGSIPGGVMPVDIRGVTPVTETGSLSD